MKWAIPAKTFLLGEYAAVAEGSAILLTTTPYFELSLNSSANLTNIHPQSPAGLWWLKQQISQGLSWYDPYKTCGGLGASSGQFLAVYLASCTIKQVSPSFKHLLTAYYHCAWNGQGLRPSGYDVIAQSQVGCVYINKQEKALHSFAWPFQDLSFLLIHTGNKLATHHHLQQATLPAQISHLSALVEKAKHAFATGDSNDLVSSINQYHEKLTELNLVTDHSLKLIKQFKTSAGVLAVKGCGALGADVILIITAKSAKLDLKKKLLASQHPVIATEENLTNNKNFPLITDSL